MATKQKVENYTAEQTATLKAGYLEVSEKDAATRKAFVESMAVTLNKSVRSVVAKLSREGVYKAAEYVSKTGEKPIKKDAHADAIAKVLGLSEADADSLTKANKSALKAIFAAIANSKPIEPGDGNGE